MNEGGKVPKPIAETSREMRAIRSSQPRLEPAEMRLQLERNRRKPGKTLRFPGDASGQ